MRIGGRNSTKKMQILQENAGNVSSVQAGHWRDGHGVLTILEKPASRMPGKSVSRGLEAGLAHAWGPVVWAACLRRPGLLASCAARAGIEVDLLAAPTPSSCDVAVGLQQKWSSQATISRPRC